MVRSKDHLNRPSHCYVKEHCLCNFPHKSRLATHPASPHSSLDASWLSRIYHNSADTRDQVTRVTITRVTQRDSHVTTHHKTWLSGNVEKMFSHQQVLSWGAGTRENIHSSCSEEARTVVNVQSWGVLLITLCRSHGHLDSSHCWPIRSQD